MKKSILFSFLLLSLVSISQAMSPTKPQTAIRYASVLFLNLSKINSLERKDISITSTQEQEKYNTQSLIFCSAQHELRQKLENKTISQALFDSENKRITEQWPPIQQKWLKANENMMRDSEILDKKIISTASSIAQKKGATAVIPYYDIGCGNNNLAYINPAYDITDEVSEILNQNYKK